MSELESRVEELEERVSELEDKISEGNVMTDSSDLRSFVEEVKPENHDERALAIALFKERTEERENLTIKEIEDGYRECRKQKYSNMSVLTSRLNQKGLLMKDGQEGNTQLWRVTAEGENYIEQKIKEEKAE